MRVRTTARQEADLQADGADAVAFCTEEFPRLTGALGLYVGDRAVAEELAQEALLRACRRWERVSKLESPGGWTWRVARNLANSHLRRRMAERRARARVIDERQRGVAAIDTAAQMAMREAVAALPERQRTVLVMRYFLDRSVQQTGDELGMSEDAVRSLTKRAIAALRDRFGGAAPELVQEVCDD